MDDAGGHEMGELVGRAASIAAEYRRTVGDHAVAQAVDPADVRAGFARELPENGLAAAQVLDALVAAAAPGLVATAGPRYFGFVIGGALPAASAADMVAIGWDQ